MVKYFSNTVAFLSLLYLSEHLICLQKTYAQIYFKVVIR